MRRKLKVLGPIVALLLLVALLLVYLHGHNVAILNPAGEISHKERNLMLVALGLSAIVVLPVFALTIFIVWKYRETNKRAKKYQPDWSSSRVLETIWWGVPCAIILILSIITWQSTYSLDPYKALAASQPPLRVQVVSLDWKWLFIYPSQQVASVNELVIPANTSVEFDITSDTVMNSFWIPNLGSQIYSMPGMETVLHLSASKIGTYPGSSANISGKGFADMAFNAKVVSSEQFDTWVQGSQQKVRVLDAMSYEKLAKLSTPKPSTYWPVRDDLFGSIISRYLRPGMTLDGATNNQTETQLDTANVPGATL